MTEVEHVHEELTVIPKAKADADARVRSLSFESNPSEGVVLLSEGNGKDMKKQKLRQRLWKLLRSISCIQSGPKRKMKKQTHAHTQKQARTRKSKLVFSKRRLKSAPNPESVQETSAKLPTPLPADIRTTVEDAHMACLNAAVIRTTTLATEDVLSVGALSEIGDGMEQSNAFSMNELLEMRAQHTPEPSTASTSTFLPQQLRLQHPMQLNANAPWPMQNEEQNMHSAGDDVSETVVQSAGSYVDDDACDGDGDGAGDINGSRNTIQGNADEAHADALDDDDEPLPASPIPMMEDTQEGALISSLAMVASSAPAAAPSTLSSTATSSSSTLMPPQSQLTFVVSPFVEDDYWNLQQNFGRYEDLPEGIRHLNRYHNVLPTPSTRVVLKELDGEPTSSYINANYIRSFDGVPRAYVAAQGPKPTTVADFWRMAWETNSRAIIMVTGLVELGKNKCARYWPEVRYNQEMDCGDVDVADINIAVMGGYRKNTYITSKIRLRRNGEERMIRHYWFDSWPDHGVPDRSDTVVAMLKSVRGWSNNPNHPWIVHCSAGIGRTGTFIAIDQGVHSLASNQKVNTNTLIEQLREQRGGMVQHLEQAEFVQRCLEEYAASAESFRSSNLAALSKTARMATAAAAAKYISDARDSEKVQKEEIEEADASPPPPSPRRAYELSALAILNQLGDDGKESAGPECNTGEDYINDEEEMTEDEMTEDEKENRSIDEGEDGRVPEWRQNQLFRKETRRAKAASMIGGRRGHRERQKMLQRAASANAARDQLDQFARTNVRKSNV